MALYCTKQVEIFLVLHMPSNFELYPEILWDSAAAAAAAAAMSLQCPTLCDPIAGSPPGSPVPGILQARILEWVAISFSNAWKWKVKVKSLSPVRLFETPWTAAYQAPLPVGFSRQEYWSGVPLPSPNKFLPTLKKNRSGVNLTLHRKELGTEQTKPKVSLRKEIIN